MKLSSGSRTKALFRTVAVVTVVAAVFLPHGTRRAASAEVVALKDLEKVDELQKSFNRDEGKMRLILLLSPT